MIEYIKLTKKLLNSRSNTSRLEASIFAESGVPDMNVSESYGVS